jgi:hypothetical protein
LLQLLRPPASMSLHPKVPPRGPCGSSFRRRPAAPPGRRGRAGAGARCGTWRPDWKEVGGIGKKRT